MATIKSENFDSATPPAAPAGWSFNGALETSTTVKRSGANACHLVEATAVGAYGATWSTQDGQGGRVKVSCYFRCGTIGGFGNQCRVFARVASSVLSSNSYWAEIALDPDGYDQASIAKTVSGAPTYLANINAGGFGYFQASVWFLVELTCDGTNLSMRVQRDSDSKWLDSGGTWQSSSAFCCTTTDSAITGQGYSGLALSNGATSQGMYADDWLLESLDANLSPYSRTYKPYRPPNTQYWT